MRGREGYLIYNLILIVNIVRDVRNVFLCFASQNYMHEKLEKYVFLCIFISLWTESGCFRDLCSGCVFFQVFFLSQTD